MILKANEITFNNIDCCIKTNNKEYGDRVVLMV